MPDNTVVATSAYIQDVLDGRQALPHPLAEQAAALLLLSRRCDSLASARALLRHSFSRIAA
ncbi:hypothetical protein [Acidithiobacillus sp. AMEEHan]|uniref:hypothetical protein n=1 Tax=Acidithiobacillus sp. AMEEHan TaxID=2994951 RepID=UPI0027E5406C|nr:hypothetical protein [Acidithiobacillus sp. AMEEHan]